MCKPLLELRIAQNLTNRISFHVLICAIKAELRTIYNYSKSTINTKEKNNSANLT